MNRSGELMLDFVFNGKRQQGLPAPFQANERTGLARLSKCVAQTEVELPNLLPRNIYFCEVMIHGWKCGQNRRA
ncbi:MAG: hypothetical protein Q7T20_00060, partial [Saprospiraceae bacterium]|nr:hypothetical protein [Saprospiraceae bacterium]